MSNLISRQAAIDALWKALYAYEDKTEKQFVESDELDINDWIQHRIFVQNMSDIDRQTIQNLPTIEAETVNNGRKSRIITNADNLRSIQNDMQLAIFMGSVNACPYDRDDALFECEKWNGACDRCWLYWLKQEVEGDGTETLDEVEE